MKGYRLVISETSASPNFEARFEKYLLFYSGSGYISKDSVLDL